MAENIGEWEREKIRIVYFTSYSELYGANRSLLEMIGALKSKHSIEPIVITPQVGSLNKELDKLNIINKAFYFKPWIRGVDDSRVKIFLKYFLTSLINYFAKRRIINYLKEKKNNLIHTNTSIINIGAQVATEIQVPHIWHIREYGEEDYNISYFRQLSDATRFIFKHSEKVIFISNSLAQKYEKFIEDKPKVEIIYNGANKEKYYSSYKRNNVDECFNIVCSGLIHLNKNQIEILRALNILVNDKKIKDIKLLLVGSGCSQYINELKNYTTTHDLEDNVFFLGYQQNVESIIKECHLGIVPSKKEAFGRVTIEYMLAGLPVIASGSGANPEIVDDGVTGFLYELGNPKDLSDKIMRLYFEREQLEIFARNSQVKALKNYISDVNAEKVYTVYKQVL